jgi:hypothetical protein
LKTKKEVVTIRTPEGNVFEILDLLGQNQDFEFYGVVSENYPEQSLILKIVLDKTKNYILEREAFLLNEMSEAAERIDEGYVQTHNGNKLNYQMGFPKLVESFISEEHDGHRILVIRLTMSNSLTEISPIDKIREIEKVRVDPKTSVWILGKLLKIVAFAHDQLFATVGKLDAENIFIVKENHLITIFDWSKSIIHSSPLSQKTAMSELRQVVKTVILFLGGDPDTGNIPDHEQLEGGGIKYHELLKSLLTKDFESVYDAHRYFYEKVEEFWERKYHPFTTIPY